jgi:hypothetical protein
VSGLAILTIYMAWVLGMTVIGAFAYRRGWKATPLWIRIYVWCAIVVEVIVWLPPLLFPMSPQVDLPDTRNFPDFVAFPYAIAEMFLEPILVYLGIAIGAVLLVVMLVRMFISAKISETQATTKQPDVRQ